MPKRNPRDGFSAHCDYAFGKSLGSLTVEPSPKKKRTGPSMTAGPSQCLLQHYPLVTTGAAGGGAFPLPMYCAQPAMLKRASTAAVPRVSFFIGVVPLS